MSKETTNLAARKHTSKLNAVLAFDCFITSAPRGVTLG